VVAEGEAMVLAPKG